MDKAFVALRLHRKSNDEMAALADIIIKGFIASVAVYNSPNPTLADVSAHLASFVAAKKNWGEKGNRGSHQSLLILRFQRRQMHNDLAQLAEYAQNKTPGDRVNLASIGWELKRDRHRIGKLEAVQDLHQFISRNVNAGTLKLKWAKPLNAFTVKIPGFRILRSATSSFAQAVQIGVSTKTSFIDASPGNGIRYYWVIPFNAFGDGVLSDLCAAAALPVSM